jgi:pimeloyl-ACP methyl ester carboxylesterase
MQTLTRDGVRLAYVDAGSGDPPFVLVHGWTCDHTYFAPQAEHFRRDHRVVAVDLRGHGESDKPEQDYTMAGFAGDLAWLCGELELRRPVVVGHSMGGVIALEMAARHPGAIGAVVAVDSPILPPQWVRDLIDGVVPELKGPEFRDASRAFVGQALFLPTDDEQRKVQIVEHMSSAPQHVMASAMVNIFAWDSAAAAAACKVPTLLINATVPLAEVERFKEHCPQLVVGQTVGAGHFNQLEVPEQVNAMIERFMITSGLRETSPKESV